MISKEDRDKIDRFYCTEHSMTEFSEFLDSLTAENEKVIPYYIAAFMDRITNADIDEYDWSYICNSTDKENAVKEYEAWLRGDK